MDQIQGYIYPKLSSCTSSFFNSKGKKIQIPQNYTNQLLLTLLVKWSKFLICYKVLSFCFSENTVLKSELLTAPLKKQMVQQALIPLMFYTFRTSLTETLKLVSPKKILLKLAIWLPSTYKNTLEKNVV